jgi:UDP-glucose 4-epimerase
MSKQGGRKMKVGVTGGSGFIGSHVVDHLLSAGHEVVVLDHRVRPHRSDVRFEDVDILDLSSLIAATRGVDALCHLAAVSNVDYAHKYPVYTVNLNVLGTTLVMEAARTNGLKQVIFASTVWVYTGTRCQGELTEDSPFYLPDAGHVYTSSKIAAEMIIQNYGKMYDQNFTILRYGIPYGPRMREELVIPIFVRRALRGEPIKIKGSGKQYRNYVYIDDLARAHTLVLGNPVAYGQVYNLEGKDPVTIRELAEIIQEIVGSTVPIETTEQRSGDYEGKTANSEKAMKEIGWRPTVTFREGIERYLDWYRCQRVAQTNCR